MNRTEPHTAVKRLGLGPGRDFVVGDIHGMFHLLELALDRLAFDPRVDRLFCTGDLVDRGLYSASARNLLNKPWVHATRGNHEQMFLDVYQGGRLDPAALEFNVTRNGAAWWLSLSEAHRKELLSLFAQLPLAIEVETTRGLVGLVHAEVPRGMDWVEFCARLEAGDHLTTKAALWGRSRVQSGDPSGVPGIDRVFSGHSIMGQVSRLGNCFFLDTGAFLRLHEPAGSLTVARLVAATTPLLDQPQTNAIVRLIDEPSATPFSHYNVPWKS